MICPIDNTPCEDDRCDIGGCFDEMIDALPIEANSLPDQFKKGVRDLQRTWNWDGLGARAIRKNACEGALEFIKHIWESEPHIGLPIVSPSIRGAIMLTWRFPDHSISVFITSRDFQKVHYEIEGPQYSSEIGNAKLATLKNLIRRCRPVK